MDAGDGVGLSGDGDVGVGKAGQDRAAVGVDDGRGIAAEPLDLAVRPDLEDAVAADRHRLGNRRAGIARVDAAVVDQQVDGRFVLALGADDQAGDDGDADDDRDQKRGEARSHGCGMLARTPVAGGRSAPGEGRFGRALRKPFGR